MAETPWRIRQTSSSGGRGVTIPPNNETNVKLPIFPILAPLNSSRSVVTVFRSDDGAVKEATKWPQAAGASLCIKIWTAHNIGHPEYQGSNDSLAIRSAHAQQKPHEVTR